MIESITYWANSNEGILAFYLFIASLIISFIIWLIKRIYVKEKDSVNSPSIKVGGNLSAGRDIIVGGRKTTETDQHEGPLIEIIGSSFKSAQGTFILFLSLRNIGDRNATVTDILLERKHILKSSFIVSTKLEIVTKEFDVTDIKILHDNSTSSKIEITYESSAGKSRKTSYEVILQPRADDQIYILEFVNPKFIS